jgi:hypothetical protein
MATAKRSKVRDSARADERKKSENTDKFSQMVSDLEEELMGIRDVNLRQKKIYEVYYPEAIRYYRNAKDTLPYANIGNDGYYTDRKYVKIACGTAYNGVLIALDGYLMARGIKLEKKRDIGYYRRALYRLDVHLLNILNSVYDTLHLSGYYDGITNSVIVKEGFREAKEIIDYIKPKA